MPKIQITLSEEEDKYVEIYKAENRLESKEQAVKAIILENKKRSKK